MKNKKNGFSYLLHVRRRSQQGCLLILLLMLWAGCEKISATLSRSTLPNLGPPIPASVKMEFDPSLTTAMANYVDSCGHPMELMIGPALEDALVQAAHQTFKSVSVDNTLAEVPPDVHIRVRLLKPELIIRSDAMYDRAPAELRLDALAEYRDPSGKLLAEQPLQTTRKERLQVEPSQKRCAYSTIDGFTHDASVALSVQFMREARALLDPGSQTAAGGRTAGGGPPADPASGPIPSQTAALSFKATIFDENGNLVLESGERVKIRVETVNAGTIPVNGVSATVTGPPVIVSQFPASSLPIGTLQPGESRSLEFTATVPQAVQSQRVDLVVAVMDSSGSALAPAQTLAAMIRPGETAPERAPKAGGSDTVDRVPSAPPGFHRPQTYVVSIGISAHRDQQSPVRKYAALDAELVANYLRALGGVPAPNVRVLLDWKALRPDIEETILDWLPAHVTSDSLVIVYFAGQAKVASSGETFLVPYEGGSSASRLYPVKDLLAGLERLKARHSLLIFDGTVSRLDDAPKNKDPQWGPSASPIVRLIGTSGVQAGLESENLHHSLFTYYLLRGLRGEADANLNREVTLGELTGFLGKTVPDVARQTFRQDQRPLVIPSLTPGSKLGSVTLTKSAPTATSDSR